VRGLAYPIPRTPALSSCLQMPMRALPLCCVQADWTALQAAACNGHAPGVKLLLGKGAEVDQADTVREGLQGLGPLSPTLAPDCLPAAGHAQAGHVCRMAGPR
jgi:hypothetical protein